MAICLSSLNNFFNMSITFIKSKQHSTYFRVVLVLVTVNVVSQSLLVSLSLLLSLSQLLSQLLSLSQILSL